MMNKGRLFVISGPSGVGKGTICNGILQKVSKVAISVPATTRLPRPGDIEGTTYFFKTDEAFDEMIKNGELLEWAEYNGNRYGTPLWAVEDMLDSGISVILEIDTQGALQIKEKMPEAVLIFIAPPAFEALEARLRGRATETEEQILRRVAVARDEMKVSHLYDYVVVNDDLEKAINETKNIFIKEIAL